MEALPCFAIPMLLLGARIAYLAIEIYRDFESRRRWKRITANRTPAR